MDRRSLLGAIAVFFSAPTAAFAREPGGGFKTIPYVPRAAEPYYAPITELRAYHVDEKIWPAVWLINRSGWVWTAESCQGHKSGWSELPMLRLVCRAADKEQLLTHIFAVIPVGHYQNDRRLIGNGGVLLHPVPAPKGWFEVKVKFQRDGLRLFEKLARAIQ